MKFGQEFPAQVDRHVEEHPYPLLFATISGSHLFGFPSADSDYDLRGVHVLPLEDVIGLKTGRETIDRTTVDDGLEIDLVTHDAKKFFGLMLKNNGYVMEQFFSPLEVYSTSEHEELKAIGYDCLTKHHAHHYLGFATNQWKLFLKEEPRRVKPLLYVFRVLLTGIHLMRTQEIEANLFRLNDSFDLPYIKELIDFKTEGPEKATLVSAEIDFYQTEYERLCGLLEQEASRTLLPDRATGAERLNDLLVSVRKHGVSQ